MNMEQPSAERREFDPARLAGAEAFPLTGNGRPGIIAGLQQEFGVKSPDAQIASILKPAPAVTPNAPGLA